MRRYNVVASIVVICAVWGALCAILTVPCWWATGSLLAGLVLGYTASWGLLAGSWVMWWVCAGSAAYARAEARR